MCKIMKDLAFVMVLAGLFAMSSSAQDKKVVVNADGSYSVIEYPVDKEVTLKLVPMSGVTSTGTARVLRTADGTKVYFDFAGAPEDWKNVYAYAVDPAGSTTFLGPITFSSGAGKAEFMTPARQFMLVVSPTEGLKTYDSSTTYVFRSEAPAGYAIIPRSATMATTDAVADVVSTTASYDVPMLGMAKYKDKTTEVRLKFSGEMKGLEAKAFLKPVGGKTQIKMKFDDLQKVPMNKRFVLWTSSPEGYTKIGQIVHTGNKDTAEIKGETALSDFGMFLTVEDTDVDRPTSRMYSTFTVFTP